MRSPFFKFTIGLACCALLVASMMPGVSAASRKDNILEFSDACYDEDSYGYFDSSRQPAGSGSTVSSTHAAVSLRGLLGLSLTSADGFSQAANIPFFVSASENDEKGGYRDFQGGFETVDNTYKAFMILDLLNVSVASLPLHLNFTINASNPSGGYGANPDLNATPSVFSTYHVVRVLGMNASLNLVNASAVNGFLQSCKTSSGYAGVPGGTTTSIVATAMAVALYQGPLVEFRGVTLTGQFIANITARLDTARSATGGFIDAAIEPEPSIYTTHHAISIARDLALPIPGGEASTVAWLLGLQNPDGGFSDGPTRDTSSLVVTYHAVAALVLLEPTMTSLNQQAPWSLVQVGGIIAIIGIIAAIVAVIVIAWQVKKRNRI